MEREDLDSSDENVDTSPISIHAITPPEAQPQVLTTVSEHIQADEPPEYGSDHVCNRDSCNLSLDLKLNAQLVAIEQYDPSEMVYWGGKTQPFFLVPNDAEALHAAPSNSDCLHTDGYLAYQTYTDSLYDSPLYPDWDREAEAAEYAVAMAQVAEAAKPAPRSMSELGSRVDLRCQEGKYLGHAIKHSLKESAKNTRERVVEGLKENWGKLRTLPESGLPAEQSRLE
jgi:hypothetical protein